MTSLSPRPRAAFRKRLLRWYRENRRLLPWRLAQDPYPIWVSEVMLQQTRVAAVLEHYARFLLRFPDVKALAAAREASVLAAWSGLGYYRRARAMHQAARVVVRERGGKFPRTAEEWRQLPGIGRYSAAAIASIAFAEPAAVVDGNVERVLRRVHANATLRGEALWSAASELLDARHPGDFNQAMMELGATLCLPVAPRCGECPVFARCATRGVLPAAPSRPQQQKSATYALARQNGSVLLQQRPAAASLMPGMWELPPLAPSAAEPLLRLRHSITTTQYAVQLVAHSGRRLRGEWVPLGRLSRLPLTGLARKALRKLEMM